MITTVNDMSCGEVGPDRAEGLLVQKKGPSCWADIAEAVQEGRLEDETESLVELEVKVSEGVAGDKAETGRLNESRKTTPGMKLRSQLTKFGECSSALRGAPERGITFQTIDPISFEFNTEFLRNTRVEEDDDPRNGWKRAPLGFENGRPVGGVMTKEQIPKFLGMGQRASGRMEPAVRGRLGAWNLKQREKLGVEEASNAQTGQSNRLGGPGGDKAGAAPRRYMPPNLRKPAQPNDAEAEEIVLLLKNVLEGTCQHDIEELVDAALNAGSARLSRRPTGRRYRSYKARGFERATNQVKVGWGGDTRPVFLIFQSPKEAQRVQKILDGHLYGSCKLSCEFKTAEAGGRRS